MPARFAILIEFACYHYRLLMFAAMLPRRFSPIAATPFFLFFYDIDASIDVVMPSRFSRRRQIRRHASPRSLLTPLTLIIFTMIVDVAAAFAMPRLFRYFFHARALCCRAPPTF